MPNTLDLKKIPVPKKLERDFPDVDFPSYPPTFSLDTKQVPEIENWKVGEKYYMVIEIEQTGKHINRKKKVNGEFKIVAYKTLKHELSDKEIEKIQGEALSNG